MYKIAIFSLFAAFFALTAYLWLRANRAIADKRKDRNVERKVYKLDLEDKTLTEVQMKVEEDFKLAGNPLGLNYKRFVLSRDIGFSVFITYICVKWVILGNGNIPWMLIVIPVILYAFVFSFHKYSAFHFFMSHAIEFEESKKNFDLFNMFQMFLNEYEQKKEKPYQVEALMREFKKYLPHIDLAINEFLMNVNKLPSNYAYDVFARVVGTELGKQLANILFEISQVGAENGRDVLLQRYDEFRLKRQEEVKSRVKMMNGICWAIAFGGAYFVLASLMFVTAYLQYSETQNIMFTVG